MTDKPIPDAEKVRRLRNYLEDDRKKFIFSFHFRARALLEETDLPKVLIALEMLESSFSAFEAEYRHQELSEAYPVEAWREDTVEVPRAWLRPLVDGWKKYKAAPTGTTLGESLGLEGSGQGKAPARKRLSSFNRMVRLSNAVLVEYLAERASGGPGSWERACAIVAAAEGVSLDTVKRASETRRKRTMSDLELVGALEGKTSRSRAPESES